MKLLLFWPSIKLHKSNGYTSHTAIVSLSYFNHCIACFRWRLDTTRRFLALGAKVICSLFNALHTPHPSYAHTDDERNCSVQALPPDLLVPCPACSSIVHCQCHYFHLPLRNFKFSGVTSTNSKSKPFFLTKLVYNLCILLYMSIPTDSTSINIVPLRRHLIALRASFRLISLFSLFS